MNPPLAEQIAENVADALNLVKIDGGYSVDLTAVRRSRRGETPSHGLCVIHQGAQTLESNPSHLIQQWKVEFILEIYVIQSEKAVDEPIDKQVNLIAADVIRALMADPQRGGVAHDTLAESISPLIEGENGYSGFVMTFSVQFANLETDQTAIEA